MPKFLDGQEKYCKILLEYFKLLTYLVENVELLPQGMIKSTLL